MELIRKLRTDGEQSNKGYKILVTIKSFFPHLHNLTSTSRHVLHDKEKPRVRDFVANE